MANAASAPERRLRTGRLEAFGDGVFAVVITLLVLEISVPAGRRRAARRPSSTNAVLPRLHRSHRV